MLANELLSEISYRKIAGTLDKEIRKVVLDSRQAASDRAFVAIQGLQMDGHKFLKSAAEKGSPLLIIDDRQTMFSEAELIEIADTYQTAIVSVPDSREAFPEISCTFFGHPADKVKLIGITGTKGKTTSTYIVHEILENSGAGCGLIGSIENKVGRKAVFSVHTTPEAWEFQELLNEMEEAGVHNCVMEVSSLGLKFLRTHGAKFEVGVFTNLFLDHISPEEHEDEEDYFRSKLMLFDRCRLALINKESRRFEEIREYASSRVEKVYTYSLHGDADFTVKNIRPGKSGQTPGMHFTLVTPTYEVEMFVPLLCNFNVDNALCASASAYLAGVSKDGIRDGVARVYVPGRMEQVNNNLGLQVFVDYAHNGDSLRVLLEALRVSCKGKIITVFGCGGNRSKTRRLTMGEMSARYSDFSVVTADNSRQEEFSDITELIIEGINKVPGAKYCIIEDRKEAISYAVSMATPDDYVVIAGKGHERTMEMKQGIIDFVDSVEAGSALRELEEKRKAEQ